MNDVTRISKHEVRYEADTGFIYIVSNGALNADELRVLTSTLAEYAARSGPDEPAFILADGRKSTGLTTDARKAMTTGPTSFRAYVAAFGVSVPVRVVLNLVMKAVAMIGRDNVVLRFVSDITEAREWLAEAQRSYRAQVAASKVGTAQPANPP
ncbi:MAG TPA: hypothetical protein VM580_25925 [Labilithrix sp.]|jgi:hypothetical protein|nr:hypothetical protein [Labilithrix sp.]